MINDKMQALGAKRSVIREIFEYGKKRKSEIGVDNVFDFSLGNPSVSPPKEVTDELLRLIETENGAALHGYTSALGDFDVRAAIANHINKTESVNVSADCIYMTVGAAAALTSSIGALTCQGEEVIVFAPYFPEYKVFIEKAGGVIREVLCNPDTLLPDISELDAAINEKTAAVIINSPNNPTGVVYDESAVSAICDLLKKKEDEFGKVIYLISDEPYRELVYDGVNVPYLIKYYNDTVITYSFSKSLSLPGERIGYVLISPNMTEKEAVFNAVAGSARALGYVCAPSLLQKIIPAVLGKTSDISIYDRNRKMLWSALSEYGYTVIKPEGAFYLFLRSPIPDAKEFCEAAKEFELLLVPSDDFGYPGYVRIAYCVNTDVIERSLPAFYNLAKKYGKAK